MRVINIMENTEGDAGCTIGHGLSFYIETQKHKLLVDTGPSADILENAEKLGIILPDVDAVILSHGHYDHAGGILPFAEMNPTAKIYMHSQSAAAYYAYDGREKGYHYIGIDPKITELRQIVYTEGEVQIDEELSLFDGITGRRNWPETNKRLKIKAGEEYVQDQFCHEQCLVIKTEGETLLLSGCAHNGILNILDRYREIYSDEPDRVISGFHMMKKTEYTEREKQNIRDTAHELKQYHTIFYTCHCTGIPAYEEMKEIMGEQLQYVHCGDEIMPYGYSACEFR